MKKILAVVSILSVFLTSSLYAQVNGEILERSVDPDGNGYTVMRVWGTYYEMGYAHGYLLAEEVDSYVENVKSYLTTEGKYDEVKNYISQTAFLPDDVDQEIDGMVDGVKASIPSSPIDADALKVYNTIGDWFYAISCRSHSCWGSFVEEPTRTLSSRRLDFPDLTAIIGTSKDHLLCVRLPADSSKTKWAGLMFPGSVCVITGVNEFGALVSTHDSEFTQPGWTPPSVSPTVITRSASTRYALTMALPPYPSQQLNLIYNNLQSYTPYIGCFVNCYIPEGNGGVLTCNAYPSDWSPPRVPQSDYFDGEVIITTNDQTDGHSTPPGGEYFWNYYNGTKPKHLADHWQVLADNPLSDPEYHNFHQLSVAYRSRNNMTIWFDGTLGTGPTPRTPIVKVEWYDLGAGFLQPELVLEKGEYGGDQNLYLYNVPVRGDSTYWNAAARNPSPLARDLWVIPSGNNMVAMTEVDPGGGGGQKLALIKLIGGADQNLYLYNVPIQGDRPYWDAHARNPSPMARDFWMIPAGNDTALIADGGRSIGSMKNQGGDYNLYLYNTPAQGDWTYWDAAWRNPHPLARDLWVIPGGNDAVAMCGLDTTGDTESDSLLVVRNTLGNYTVYLWNMPAAGDWTYLDAIARNPSPRAVDLWAIPQRNDIVDVSGINRGGEVDELAVMEDYGGDYNFYLWNAPAPGDWSSWDAAARNPSPLAHDFWQIPAGNNTVGVVAPSS